MPLKSNKKKSCWAGFISEERYVPHVLSLSVWIAIVVLFIYPLIYGIWTSFLVDGQLSLGNYSRLFNDRTFWNSLWITLLYVVIYTFGIMLVGFVTALIMDLSEEHHFPGNKMLSSLLTLPYAIPDVVGALIWLWMLNPRQGIINYLLSFLGVSGVQWLTNPQLALISVVLVEVWRLFPMHTLIILAAFKTVPKSLYEAASLDGASMAQQFFHITLPSIMNIMKFLILLTVVWSFKRFTMLWLLTQGGPMGATETLAILIYKQAFKFFNRNYAAAASVILLVLVSVVAVFYMQFSRSRRNEGELS